MRWGSTSTARQAAPFIQEALAGRQVKFDQQFLGAASSGRLLQVTYAPEWDELNDMVHSAHAAYLYWSEVGTGIHRLRAWMTLAYAHIRGGLQVVVLSSRFPGFRTSAHNGREVCAIRDDGVRFYMKKSFMKRSILHFFPAGSFRFGPILSEGSDPVRH